VGPSRGQTLLDAILDRDPRHPRAVEPALNRPAAMADRLPNATIPRGGRSRSAAACRGSRFRATAPRPWSPTSCRRTVRARHRNGRASVSVLLPLCRSIHPSVGGQRKRAGGTEHQSAGRRVDVGAGGVEPPASSVSGSPGGSRRPATSASAWPLSWANHWPAVTVVVRCDPVVRGPDVAPADGGAGNPQVVAVDAVG
jgi:hypothetical protein